MKLYLDDERPTPAGWVGVSTAEEAIIVLRSGIVTHLSLDHDLGESSGTGYDVIKWLEEAVHFENHPFPVTTVHSDNGPGRNNIQLTINAIERRLNERTTSR